MMSIVIIKQRITKGLQDETERKTAFRQILSSQEFVVSKERT
jgi:hypothetical protein